MSTLLSTGEAARLCGVSRSTFKRWFSQFKPEMRRTPGGDIRISRAELVAFASACGLPVDPFGETCSALVAVRDHALENALITALLRNIPDARSAIARDDLTLGLELARLEPHLVILEPESTPTATAARCRRIRESVPAKTLRIGLAAPADDSLALPGGPDMALGDDTRRAALDRFVLSLADARARVA